MRVRVPPPALRRAVAARPLPGPCSDAARMSSGRVGGSRYLRPRYDLTGGSRAPVPPAGSSSPTTGIVSVPIPSMVASITSPGCRKRCSPRTAVPIPTPPEVPLLITSPGKRVMIDEPYSIELVEGVDHVACARLLHLLAAHAEGLVQVLHRVAVELLRHDPRAHWREGVVALADEPVGRERVSARRSSSPVGDVDGDRVAEDVVRRVGGRDVLGGAADHRAEFDLPVGAVAAVRDDHLVAVADDRAPAGLQEEIGDAAVLPALPAGLGALPRGCRSR